MEAILSLPPLRDTIQKYELNARKEFGQHFLLDLNITDKIARAAGNLDHCIVIEVGPGPGGLTRSLLLHGAAKVIAIEKDQRCIAALEELKSVAGEKLEIIKGDALEIDEKDTVKKHLNNNTLKIVSNLPYNISTVLLVKWLGSIRLYTQLTLMFQKEVAERITAKPGGKDYGRLSVLSQWLCDIRHEFDLPARAFVPPPKVDSAVLTFIPRTKPLAEADKSTLEKLLQAVFSQRRKMLRKSLRQLCDTPEKILEACQISGERRPETLGISEFCALAQALHPQRRRQDKSPQ